MIRQHQIDPDVSKTGNPNTGTNIFYRITSLLGADKVYVQEPERLFRKPAAQAGFGGAWRTGAEIRRGVNIVVLPGGTNEAGTPVTWGPRGLDQDEVTRPSKGM